MASGDRHDDKPDGNGDSDGRVYIKRDSSKMSTAVDELTSSSDTDSGESSDEFGESGDEFEESDDESGNEPGDWDALSSTSSLSGSSSSDSSSNALMIDTDTKEEQATSTFPNDLNDPETIEEETDGRYLDIGTADVTSTRNDLHIDTGTKEEDVGTNRGGARTKRSVPPARNNMLDVETFEDNDEDDEKTVVPSKQKAWINNMYDPGTKEEEQENGTSKRGEITRRAHREELEYIVDKGTEEEEVTTHGDLLMDPGTGQQVDDPEDDEASFEEEFNKERASQERVDKFEMLMRDYPSKDTPDVGELYEVPTPPSSDKMVQIMIDIQGDRYETRYRHDMRMLFGEFRNTLKDLVRRELQRTGSLKFSLKETAVSLETLERQKEYILSAYNSIGPFTSVQRLLSLVASSTTNVEYNPEKYKTTIAEYHHTLLQKMKETLALHRIVENESSLATLLQNVKEIETMIPYHAGLDDTGIVFYETYPKSPLLYFLSAVHRTLQRLRSPQMKDPMVVKLNQNGMVFVNYDNYAFPSPLYLCSDGAEDIDITMLPEREGRIRPVVKTDGDGAKDVSKITIKKDIGGMFSKRKEEQFETVEVMTLGMLRASLEKQSKGQL